jgi:hypothetical protein
MCSPREYMYMYPKISVGEVVRPVRGGSFRYRVELIRARKIELHAALGELDRSTGGSFNIPRIRPQS